MSWGWNHNCPRGAAGRQAAGDARSGDVDSGGDWQVRLRFDKWKGENSNGMKMLRERGIGTGRGQAHGVLKAAS